MKVSYIGHSGFLVELERTLLLFDYSGGELPPLEPGKALYVFSSHSHGDHFQFSVFDVKHPAPRYVFSDDIRQARNRNNFIRHGVSGEIYDSIRFLRPHQQVQIGDVAVETLDSTDLGVAFLVEAEGKSILHMGDLHWWVWEGEPETDNARMEAKWNGELSRITGRRFDVVFGVLDPRQEGDFWRGLDQLARTVNAGAIYPMHMWDRPELIDRLREMPCSAPYRDKLPAVDFYRKA